MLASQSTTPSASSPPPPPSGRENAGAARRQFRFRARYALFAYGMLVIGVGFALAPLVRGFAGDARVLSMVIGCGSIALAGLYLMSPAWRFSLVVDDDGLEVVAGSARRFRLAWNEIVNVVASAETKTCFVDGGEPSRSLTVPGKGARAPYDIEDRASVYDLIVSHTPAERIEWVSFLDDHQAADSAANDDATDNEPPKSP